MYFENGIDPIKERIFFWWSAGWAILLWNTDKMMALATSYIYYLVIQPPTAIVHRRFEGTTTIIFRHTYYFKSKSNSKPIVNGVYIAIEFLYN